MRSESLQPSTHPMGRQQLLSVENRRISDCCIQTLQLFLRAISRAANSDRAHRQRDREKNTQSENGNAVTVKWALQNKGNIRSFTIVNLVFTHIIVGYTYLLRAWALLVSFVAFLFVGISVKLFSFLFNTPSRRIRKDPPLWKQIHAFV